MELRAYQRESINEIREALRVYRRIIFQLPTGGGKSLIFSYIAKASINYGRRTLILSDRTEILNQNGGTLKKVGLEVGYINPRSRNIPTEQCCVAMCQTLKRRIDKPEWAEYIKSIEMLIIDEAHSQISDYIHGFLDPKCFVIGVTATPSRTGGMRQLGSMYKAMVVGVSVKGLIEQGFLAAADTYSIAAPKLEEVPIDYATGEYNQRLLAAKFEDKMRYTGVVKEYNRIASGKKAICFCVSSEQAIGLTKEFVESGVEAKYVLSGSFEEDSVYSGNRSEVIEGFKKNEFKVLVNVGIATAGFDAPDVECVILDFATASITKYLQSIGRGSRVTPSKSRFTVIDCGGNYNKFGLYDADRSWCLWHTSNSGNGIMVLKECDQKEKNAEGIFGCGALVPAQAKVCPCCGRKFITDKDEFVLHLEKIVESEEEDSVAAYAAKKKQEGWKLSRIMIQICLRNFNHPKKAFTEAYLALYPQKALEDANRYWFVFDKKYWSKVKHKTCYADKLETKLF